MSTNVLAIDVGEKRVGIAIARAGIRIALPLTTLERQNDNFWQHIDTLLKENNVGNIVIGLPRGLNGQNTAQTRAAQAFGAELSERFQLPLIWQDEALTSVLAEKQLQRSGKQYEKSDIDAVAASFILTDYLEGKGETT